MSGTITVELKGDLSHVERYRKALQQAFSGNSESFDRFGKRVLAMYASYIQRRFNTFSRGGGDWKPLAPSTIYRRARATVERARKEADSNLRRGVDTKGKSFGPAEHEAAIKRAHGRAHRFLNRVLGVPHGATRGIRIGPATIAKGAVGSGQVSILRDTGTLFNALSINGPANVMRKRGPVFEFGIGGNMQHPSGGVTVGRIAAYHQNGGAIPNRPPQRKILVVPPSSDTVWSEWDRAASMLIKELWNSSKGGR